MVTGNVHPKVALTCGCGLQNCLEARASGTGIANLAKKIIELSRNKPRDFAEFAEYERSGGRALNLAEAVKKSKLPALFDQKQNQGTVFTSKDVCHAMYDGDQLAYYILNTTARMTAEAIVNIAQIHDLERVGIGGGVGENNPKYVEMIQDHVKQILVKGNKLLPNGVVVEIGPLGTVANDYGALSLVAPEKHRAAWAKTMQEEAKKRKEEKQPDQQFRRLDPTTLQTPPQKTVEPPHKPTQKV